MLALNVPTGVALGQAHNKLTKVTNFFMAKTIEILVMACRGRAASGRTTETEIYIQQCSISWINRLDIRVMVHTMLVLGIERVVHPGILSKSTVMRVAKQTST